MSAAAAPRLPLRVLAALALAACGGASSPRASGDAYAPQLFTVEELRDGNPAGRVIELRIEVEGEPVTIETWEFTAVDATTATIHSISRDEAGASIADDTGTSTWAELHDHGRFPTATTTYEDGVSLTVPAGTFTTRVYTVIADRETRRFWFAVDLPGPPVQFTTERDGKTVMRTVMLRAR